MRKSYMQRGRRLAGAAALAVLAACSAPGSPSVDRPDERGGAAGAAAGAPGADAAAGQGGTSQCPSSLDAGVADLDAGVADGAAADGGSVAAACGACEMAHGSPDNLLCPAILLTANYTLDPDTGNQVAVGWGLDTLPTAGERAAGAALLHCLNVHRCATDGKNQCPGDNPELGCFCGAGIAPVDCLSGAGIHGPCIAEYAAAAAVTPGGPPQGSSQAALALYVAQMAGDPTGPIGLADMIASCAIADPCSICLQL